MTKNLWDLLDEVLPDDDEATPSLAVEVAREQLAALLGLHVMAAAADVSTNDLAAYASGSLTSAELLEFKQKLERSSDAAVEVASALRMLADVKADQVGKARRELSTEDFMPLSLADEIENLGAPSGTSASRILERSIAWKKDMLQTLTAVLKDVRETSGQMIAVLSGLLPNQSDAWSFPAPPAFATRATSRRTTMVKGFGKKDGSSISITADRSPGSVRFQVVVRDLPSDQSPPTLVVFSEAPGVEEPLTLLDPIIADAANGFCDLYYEPDPMGPEAHVILMLGHDGAIIFAAQIAAATMN